RRTGRAAQALARARVEVREVELAPPTAHACAEEVRHAELRELRRAVADEAVLVHEALEARRFGLVRGARPACRRSLGRAHRPASGARSTSAGAPDPGRPPPASGASRSAASFMGRARVARGARARRRRLLSSAYEVDPRLHAAARRAALRAAGFPARSEGARP